MKLSKWGLLIFLSIAISTTLNDCKDWNAQNSLANLTIGIDEKVNNLLAKMSVADKAGEMTQLSIDMISVGEPYNLAEPHQLDTSKLRKIIVDLKVGSILNCGGHGYSRAHWQEIISQIQHLAINEKESGIPVIYGIDAIHGQNIRIDGGSVDIVT